MSAPKTVETPEGRGRLTAVAQVDGGWVVRVELSAGATWTGPAEELSGARDAETLKEFRRGLGEEAGDR